MSKLALGKGLGALIGNPMSLGRPEPDLEKNEAVVGILTTQVVPSPQQPRKIFRPEQLAELVESIRERGVIQPLIVRRVGQQYELIAGERRWRAATELKLEKVPAIVREATDQEVLELALVENLQRADLSPLEESRAYMRLIEQFSLTQEAIAQRVGKSRVAITHSVRLLALPEAVRSWLDSGDISVGHAKVILGLEREEEQMLAAEKVRRDNLTVRATERLVNVMRSHPVNPAALKGGKSTGKNAKSRDDNAAVDLEKQLQRHLGTRVRLSGTMMEGRLEIHYFSQGDLERLLERMGYQEGL